MSRSKSCFASAVCCTDDFRDLPTGAQALYFQLGFEADNDGAIANVKSIMRAIVAKDDDLRILAAKGYILFVDGILFITHWWVNNKKDSRNYRQGCHQEALSKLSQINDQNRAYCLVDGHQSDVSLLSVHNIKENKRNESKSKEKKATSRKSRAEAEEIIAYLNEKAHKNHRATTNETIRLINGRLKDGYTIDDFKHVIDIKVSHWLNDPEFNRNLQPSTLFSQSNFDKYLNQTLKAVKSYDRYDQMQTLPS